MRVVYIAGYGRSGTTLLDRSLGEVPGVVSLGELALAPEASQEDGHLCSCGSDVEGCPLWSEVSIVPEVVSEHLGLLVPIPPMVRERSRERHVWGEFLGSIESALGPDLLAVDSSKTTYARAARPWLLAAEGHSVFPILIWRDLPSVLESRAAARRVRGVESLSWRVLVEGYFSWTFANLVGMVAVTAFDGKIVSFTDVVGSAETMAYWLVEEAEAQIGNSDGQTKPDGSGHLIAGNRMRLGDGSAGCRPERPKLTTAQRAVFTVLSKPLALALQRKSEGRLPHD